MKRLICVGWILLAGLLTGCGAHGSAHLATGRQLPMVTPQGGIRVHLNTTSELQFNLRGFRMGLSPLAGRQQPGTDQPDPPPWLSYRLHF